jgi:UDP-glucose 4-epimerase
VPVDETAPFGRITPYGESKIKVEQEVIPLASDDFSPTYLRNTTTYG